MQEFFGCPIRHVLIHKEEAEWVAPGPRVQLQSQADRLRSQLLDVSLQAVFERHGLPKVAFKGEKAADRITRLVALGQEELIQV